jgi:hypothetical protein
LVGKHGKRDHLENVGLGWKIIGRMVLREQKGMLWAVCFKTERMVALVNTGSLKVGNFYSAV